MKRLLIGAGLAGVMMISGIISPVESKADGANCETINWGFLGTQRRTICDGPVFDNGSWNRMRVVWVPGRNLPLTCNSFGTGSYSSTSCIGGYYQPEHKISEEVYPVTPATVLPDEPGHL